MRFHCLLPCLIRSISQAWVYKRTSGNYCTHRTHLYGASLPPPPVSSPQVTQHISVWHMGIGQREAFPTFTAWNYANKWTCIGARKSLYQLVCLTSFKRDEWITFSSTVAAAAADPWRSSKDNRRLWFLSTPTNTYCRPVLDRSTGGFGERSRRATVWTRPALCRAGMGSHDHTCHRQTAACDAGTCRLLVRPAYYCTAQHYTRYTSSYPCPAFSRSFTCDSQWVREIIYSSLHWITL